MLKLGLRKDLTNYNNLQSFADFTSAIATLNLVSLGARGGAKGIRVLESKLSAIFNVLLPRRLLYLAFLKPPFVNLTTKI